jgi:hypothetical protein
MNAISKIRYLATILLSALGVRSFLFVVASLSHLALPYRPTFPYIELLQSFGLPKWIYSFAGFDGVHYLTIALNGYHSAGLIQAFFPVWPLVLRVGDYISHLLNLRFLNPITWGLAVNFLLLSGLLFLWHQFVTKVYPDLLITKKSFSKAGFWFWFPIVLILIFPTSLFYFALYSETLFLTLVLGVFLAAHYRKWSVVVALTILASATRIVGVLLVPAVILEFWWQHQTQATQQYRWQALKQSIYPKSIFDFIKKHFLMISFLMLGSLGLLSYMTYLYFTFNDSFLFKTVQSEWGHQRSSSIVLYPQVVYRYIKMLLTSFEFSIGWWSVLQEFIFGLLAPLLPLLLFKKIRPSHLLFGLLVLLVPISTGTFSSLPRYSLATFPILISLLYILKDRPNLAIFWIVCSTLLLICNTILFTQGYWVG